MTQPNVEREAFGGGARVRFVPGPAQPQSGIVLAAVLILLLLMTVVTFAAMESSSLGYRTIASMEERERSFQIAESLLASALKDPSVLAAASISPDGIHSLSVPEAEVDGLEAGATMTSRVRFRAFANASGHDAVIGSTTARAAHFVFDAQTRRANHRFPSHHRQGAWRLTPSVP